MGYFPIIKNLVERVDKADVKDTTNDEHKDPHWADYNFIHKATQYSTLHWLAFHDDN